MRLERLYNEYRELMYKVAYNVLNDKFAAEDAVHQAFIRVANNLHKISENDSHKTRNFLVIIVRNVALDIYNKRGKDNFTELTDELSSEDNSVENIVISEENLKRLISLICELKPIYQEALMLRYSQGYSNSEIAALLSIEETTVRKRIERAKTQLLKLLEEVRKREQ